MTANHDYRFRYDVGAAQALIEQMQPAIPQRWWCLAVLADAVQAAHRANPDRWGVTLRPEPIRLNVGMIEVYFFGSQDSVYLVLDAVTLLAMPPDQYQPYLTSEALKQLRQYQQGKVSGDYDSVAGSLGSHIALEQLPTAYPLLRLAHMALITAAAQTRRHPMTRQSHSPSVIDYLRNETGWTLPQPGYLQRGLQEGNADSAKESVEDDDSMKDSTMSLAGIWKVVSSPDFDDQYLHMDGEAFVRLTPRGKSTDGEYRLGLQSGTIDGNSADEGHLSFSFEGVDEMESVHGSGTAELQGEQMIFTLEYVMGDAFTFVCERKG